MYKVYYTRYQGLFYFCQIKLAQKYSKLQRYYVTDCLKIFHFHFTPSIMIKISGSSPIKLLKDVKILRFQGDWGELWAKIWYVRQSMTKYFAKSKKIKQNWTRPEDLDFCFGIGFDYFFWKLIFGGESKYKPVSLPNFEIFFLFPNFLSS